MDVFAKTDDWAIDLNAMAYYIKDMETNNSIHPWERLGLGLAPFRWLKVTIEVGPYRELDKNGQPTGFESGAPGQPMGSCKACGQGIKEVHHIASADGKRFTVGCDCVTRLCHKGERVYSEVQRASNKLKTAKRHDREKAAIEQGAAWFESVRHIAATMPHGNTWAAAKGLTLADSWDWTFKRAGNSGRLRLIDQMRKLISK